MNGKYADLLSDRKLVNETCRSVLSNMVGWLLLPEVSLGKTAKWLMHYAVFAHCVFPNISLAPFSFAGYRQVCPCCLLSS